MSLSSASLRSWFRIWASCSLQKQEQHLDLPIFDKAIIFLRADWCAQLAQSRGSRPKPLRRASQFRTWASCSGQHWLSRRDSLIRGYLDKAITFLDADWCVVSTEVPLRDGKGRKRPAARDWEAEFEGGPPPLDQSLASRISRLLQIIFSCGFVFPDRLVTLDRLTGPRSPLRARMRSRFWFPLEMVRHKTHLFITLGNLQNFSLFQTVQIV